MTYSSSTTRSKRMLSAVLASALGFSGVVGIILLGAAPAAQAAVPAPTCPAAGSMPSIGNELTFTDASPAVYVGGDYLATADAAESEGLLVVQGDATFDKATGVFNVGSVGVGSGIVPPPGEPMLQVGGALTVNPGIALDVGAGVDGGGDVLAGSAISGTVTANGGTVSDNLGVGTALAPNTNYLDDAATASAALAAQAVTGSTSVEFGAANFVGTGATDIEVFTVDAAQLATSNEAYFTNIAPNAPIVINVIGGPITYTQNYVGLNGERVDAFGPNFGNAASQILWNFVDAPSVVIAGSNQFMGSVLAPVSDVTTTASTNGRMIVGGDFTTQGFGNEQHNYPWVGGSALGCRASNAAAVGGFSAAKALTGDAANLVPAGTQFTLDYSYTDAGGTPVTGSLTLTADGTVVTGPQTLPVGTVVSFSEANLPTIDGVEWGTPQLSSPTLTITDGANQQITVTNTANTAAAAVGGFSAAKALTGDAANLVPAGTQFTLDYSYTDAGGTPVTGSLTLTADGTVVTGPQTLPVGTVVSFSEANLPTIDGVEWGTPQLSSPTLTITDGANQQITVTNTANTAAAAVGGFSAAKALTGDAANLVPAGTQFTLDYSYTDAGGTPVTGSLTLTADGTVVTGPQTLPVGTVVSFSEANLPTIDGVEWGTPQLSSPTLTITDGANQQITVTNTANTAAAAVGGFSAAKALTGDAANLVPAGTQFTLDYSYTDAGGTPVTGSLTLTADGTVVTGPQTLPVGTVVSFSEANLPTIDGVEWGTPQLSSPTLTITDGANQQITVTNTANTAAAAVGGFSAAKALTGDAANLVPAGTQFTLDYSYTDAGGTPVTGSLTLTADGTVVTGPQTLPVGTVVSFSEANLPTIDGVEWGTPQLSSPTLTITDGANQQITVTNTANTAAAALAGTGLGLPVGVVVAAMLMLVGGGALARLRRPS